MPLDNIDNKFAIDLVSSTSWFCGESFGPRELSLHYREKHSEETGKEDNTIVTNAIFSGGRESWNRFAF